MSPVSELNDFRGVFLLRYSSGRGALLLAFAAACMVASGCGGNASPAASAPTNPVVASVLVTPPAPTIAVNATEQFAATAKDSSGNIITGVSFTWNSSVTSYATVNAGGLATGLAAGTTQITATANGVTSPPDTLTVTAAQAAASLSLTGPAPVNYLGGPLAPALQVSVKDQNGNLVTGATGNVTLTLGINSAGATLSGTLQAAPVGGVAMFSNLTLDNPGTYTLTAAYPGVPSIISPPFTVLANHANLLSLAAESTTPSNWWTHTSAGFTATAATTGNLVINSLASQLDNAAAVPWTQEPQETVTYSSLSSAPHTIGISAQTLTGTTVASTLTWVDCANTDTATSQPIAPTSSTCANLTIPQSPATGGFSGYADPTMRKDLAAATVWLGYSWPHAWNPGANSTDAVDLYLTSSSDNGVTWTGTTPLWTSVQTTDPSTGLTAYTSNEILNILPGQVNGQSGETWFSVHLSYFVDQNTSIVDALVRTSSIVLNWAATPAALGSAPASQTVTFASAGLSPLISTNMNLTTLDPSLADCQQWGEPALMMKSGNLYMALLCKYGTSTSQMQPAKNSYAVFEATPNLSQPPVNWGWQYNGQLATAADGALLEGHQFIYEMDLATRADGSIVATVTPADDIANPSGGGSTQYSYGCRELLVQGLDKGNIGLAHDANGQLEVLASITASDLGPANNETGSGGCTYEPLASNGIVFVRSYRSDPRFPSLGYYTALFNSYAMP